jgi:hypothetical protein
VGGILLFRAVGASDLPRGADVAVSCGPAQRAVVRQTLDEGNPKVDIDCVQAVAGVAAATYVIDAEGRVVPAATGLDPTMQAARPAVMPVAYQPQIVSAPPVYQPVVQAPRRTATSAQARKGTSWQKRALIIGGSAGAGAGVGALVGGKKGALIGAAVGGGGAAIVDALKRD